MKVFEKLYLFLLSHGKLNRQKRIRLNEFMARLHIEMYREFLLDVSVNSQEHPGKVFVLTPDLYRRFLRDLEAEVPNKQPGDFQSYSDHKLWYKGLQKYTL